MTSPEDFAALRTRVDRLESGLAAVRRTASDARSLARLADRDVSDIRASHVAIMRSMEALRENQVEMQADITELRGDVTQLRGDVDVLRGEVTDIRVGLGVVRDGVATIIDLLRDAS